MADQNPIAGVARHEAALEICKIRVALQKFMVEQDVRVRLHTNRERLVHNSLAAGKLQPFRLQPFLTANRSLNYNFSFLRANFYGPQIAADCTKGDR